MATAVSGDFLDAISTALKAGGAAAVPALRRLNATDEIQKLNEAEGAPDVTSTNIYAGAIIGTVTAVTCISLAIDRTRGKRTMDDSCPGHTLWSTSLKIMSYMLLIPGISHILYHFNVALSFFGQTWKVRGGIETMLQLIGDLHSEGCYFAAGLITFYAIVIPVVKVLMLAVGACWRSSASPVRVSWSRRFLITVQIVSKWASPDMFAYILMMYLFRELNRPPSVFSDMTMDVGFTCFCIFCVGSTISALGMRIPALPASEKTPTRSYNAMAKWMAVAVVLLTLAFLVLLGYGVSYPCMALRMDMNLFYSQYPNLKAYKVYIDKVHLEDLVHAEVSIGKCMFSLARWFCAGELNSGVALAMYGVFVLFFSIADMLAMSTAAIQLCRSSSTDAAKTALASSRVMGRLSMLDVSVVGFLVMVLAMEDLRKKGIVASLGSGIVPLSAAAACQYFACFLVNQASMFSTEVPTEAKEGDGEAVV